jgi:protein-S-isoprenylcysteine O-methyltransferase Ste14
MAAKDAPRVVVFPPLIAAMAVGLGVVSHAVSAVDIGPHLQVRLAGVVGVVVGLGLIGAASSLMVRSGANVDPGLPTLRIITRGPFRSTRNPMYLGMCLLTAGIGLLLCDLAAASFALPLVLVLHSCVVLPEERHLTSKFGETYLGYKARVRRWI